MDCGLAFIAHEDSANTLCLHNQDAITIRAAQYTLPIFALQSLQTNFTSVLTSGSLGQIMASKRSVGKVEVRLSRIQRRTGLLAGFQTHTSDKSSLVPAFYIPHD